MLRLKILHRAYPEGGKEEEEVDMGKLEKVDLNLESALKQRDEEEEKGEERRPSFPFSTQMEDDGVLDDPKVELEDKDLWDMFNENVNEMIISKLGKRIFPAFKVRINGLDKNSKYYVMMDILPADEHRYEFHNSKWRLAGKADPEVHKPMHVHPESPNTGAHWMSKGASFHRVKLTNNMTNKNEFVSGFIIKHPQQK